MIERTYPFEDASFVIRAQEADRTGRLMGIVDVVPNAGGGHLLAPQRVDLFEERTWAEIARAIARRNSGDVNLWLERGELVRIALLEDADVVALMAPETTPQLNSTLYRRGVVEFAPVQLALLSRPGPRRFRVADLLPEGWPVTLWGDSGHGKSYIAMTIAQCVALGHPFLGLGTIPGRVLYADWELDTEEQTRRAYEVAEGLGLETPPEEFDYVRLDHPFADVLPHFQARLVETSYGLVILDSFGLACGGDPESARFVIPFYLALRQLRCSILIVDHQSRLQAGQKYREKDPFGSIYKKHLSRSGIQVQAIADEPGRRGIVLRHSKANFSAKREDIYAWLVFDAGRTILQAASATEMADAGAAEEMDTETQVEVALEDLGKGTIAAIAGATGLNSGTVSNVVRVLKRKGLVKGVGKEGHAPIYALQEKV